VCNWGKGPVDAPGENKNDDGVDQVEASQAIANVDDEEDEDHSTLLLLTYLRTNSATPRAAMGLYQYTLMVSLAITATVLGTTMGAMGTNRIKLAMGGGDWI
jgi:hypothetical protein